MKTRLKATILVALCVLATTSLAVDTKSRLKRNGILLLGDSMMRVGVGPVLKRSLASQLATSVEMRAKSATGLTRNDVYDWPAEVRRILSERGFQKAIVMIGANDCQAIRLNNKQVLAYGTVAWEHAYRSRVRAFLDLLCDGVQEVVWLGLPPMRSVKFNAKIQNLNHVVAEEVKRSRCGRYVPVTAALADARGAYQPYRSVHKKRLKLREDDGIHITQSGGLLIAQDLLRTLKP